MLTGFTDEQIQRLKKMLNRPFMHINAGPFIMQENDYPGYDLPNSFIFCHHTDQPFGRYIASIQSMDENKMYCHGPLMGNSFDFEVYFDNIHYL